MTKRKLRSWVSLSLAVLVAFLLAGVWLVRQQQRGDIADGQTPATLQIGSSSFLDGGSIPRSFSCDGAGTSPNIQLPLPPAGTKSLALVVDDPDAPFDFVHWLVYNIPAGVRDIPNGASQHGKLADGAAEGINSAETIGYTPPCPPGTKPHHYVFRVYALDVSLDLAPGQTKKQLAAAVKGHVLAEGKITALYARGH